MRIVQHNVSDAAQLKLAVLQAFSELGPVQLHCWAHGRVVFFLLPLAVLDILHVDVKEHVRQTVVNVRARRMRTRVTRVSAAWHVDGQSAGYRFLLLASLQFIFFYFKIRSKNKIKTTPASSRIQ